MVAFPCVSHNQKCPLAIYKSGDFLSEKLFGKIERKGCVLEAAVLPELIPLQRLAKSEIPKHRLNLCL
jgi:hypothetical protein